MTGNLHPHRDRSLIGGNAFFRSLSGRCDRLHHIGLGMQMMGEGKDLGRINPIIGRRYESTGIGFTHIGNIHMRRPDTDSRPPETNRN